MRVSPGVRFREDGGVTGGEEATDTDKGDKDGAPTEPVGRKPPAMGASMGARAVTTVIAASALRARSSVDVDDDG